MDPLGLTAMLNDGPSLYGYAGQSPQMFYDPTGEGAIGSAIGGAAGDSVAGPLGAMGGRALGSRAGAAVGSAIADWIFPSKNRIDDDERGGVCRFKNAKRGYGDGGMPGNNRRQNRQTDDVAKQLNLTQDQAQQLHNSVSGQNMSYRDIMNVGRAIKNGAY